MKKLILCTATLSLSVLLGSCSEGQARQSMASDSFTSAAVDPADAPSPPTRRVWANAQDGAVISPVEPIMAFIDWSTGGDVAVHNLETGENRRVTDIRGEEHDWGWGESPIFFSPDGQEIVYGFGNMEPGSDPYRYQLRVVGLDGSESRVLWTAEDFHQFISPRAWSPEHGILVGIAPENAPDGAMALIDPETHELEILREFPRGGPWLVEADFSPDGAFLAYREGPRVRMRTMADGRDRDLEIEAKSLLSWTADGSGFLIHADRQGVAGFWLVPVSEGGTVGAPQLVRGGIPMALGRGRQGDAFYYTVLVEGPQIFQTSVDMNAERMLSAPTALTPLTNARVDAPTWSPDGRYMAFGVADTDGNWRLILRSAAGDEVTNLADLGRIRNFMNLTWSSDGSALYYMTYIEDQRHLNRTDVRTGVTEELFVEPADEGPKPALITPDGTKAVISRNYPEDPENTPRGLVVKDLQSGAETVLSPDAPLALGISPDGSMISSLVNDPNGEIRRLILQPIDGGPPTVLAEFDLQEGAIERISGLDWSPDEQFIMAVYWVRTAPDEPEVRHLTAYPVDGGEPVRLGQIYSAWAKPSLHPDGQRLIYVDGEGRIEAWVMEGWR